MKSWWERHMNGGVDTSVRSVRQAGSARQVNNALELVAQASTEVHRIMAEVDARLANKEDPAMVLTEVTRDLHQLGLALES